MSISFDDFATIEQLAEESNGLTNEGKIKWAIRNRNKNGMDICLKKFGKRWLIHKPSFFNWLANKDVGDAG